MSEVYVKEPATNGKAILRTTHGDLEVELWATECPKACRNFCQLILEGYYNGTIFHRVIKDFIVQGGDATNTGDGTESIYGEPYPDEIHSRLKFRYRGMMGIASAGRGTKTNGSQFFIVLNRAPSLDGKHTLFAKVVGQTIYNLVRISEAEVDKRDRPLEPPRIIRAELVWDPFGDLEPRRLPEPPKPIGGSSSSGEVQRRAPVQNKRVLSFAGDEDDDDDEGNEKAVPSKIKSAHEVLDDPKLSKDAAYPERQQTSASSKADKAMTGARADRGAPADRAAKRPPVASTKRRANDSDASGGGSGEASQDDSESDEDDSDGPGTNTAKQKSNSRKEAINRLKREIANVGVEAEENPRKKQRAGSALEELRSGFQARAPRERAVGKEGKRQEADVISRTLKDFRSRVQALTVEATLGDSAEKDEGSPKKQKEKKVKKDKDKKEKPKDKQGKADEPEDGTFAAIWNEGDEEADTDWLSGGGLKFHVTADKAFKLDRDRARSTLEIFDPLAARGNSEVLADARKKASDKLVPQRRKLPPKSSRDDDDRGYRR